MATQRFTSLVVLLAAVLFAAACGSTTPTPVASSSASGSGAVGSGGIAEQMDAPSCNEVTDPTIAVPANSNQQQFSAPEQVTDPAHTYCAILQTDHGRIVIQLYPQYAPKNVNNFVFLASKGFYDGVPFHRVIPDFMAQTGDPTGTGAGGPGYNNIPLEVSSSPLRYDKPGVVGVARTQVPDSAGSQFFITFVPTPALDNGYTIIGQVIVGMDIVNQITVRNVDQDPNAGSITPELLRSVRIVDIGTGST